MKVAIVKVSSDNKCVPALTSVDTIVATLYISVFATFFHMTSMVRGKYNYGILTHTKPIQCFQDFTNTPVKLHHLQRKNTITLAGQSKKCGIL